MISRILLVLLIAILGITGAITATSAEPNDAEVAAREKALELAGAFGNEGFKLRDGFWGGTVKAKETKVVQVNLYAGNQYWFSLAVGPEAKNVAVKIFDEAGTLIETDPYTEENTAAAGFTATSSGPYFIKVEQSEAAAAPYCLVYSYK